MKKRSKKYRRLPPGQRLILYMMFAGVFVLLQGYSKPAELPGPQAAAVPITPVIGPPFLMEKEMTDLEKTLKEQADKPRLRTGLFAVEPASGRYVDLGGHESYAAASMIKVPVLVALMMAMDHKQVSPQQQLTMREDLVAGGSGYLQWRPVGTQISVEDAAELMIVNSDNTATNLIIDLLGGIQVLNPQFTAWGLKQTRINNLLPDFEGTNQTSPYDLAYLLAAINRGAIVSNESRGFVLRIMARTKTRTLLPPGLGVGAKIEHKTGDIGGMVGDAGIVTAPGGQTYIVVAQVERPRNDRRANELIRALSRTVYAGLIADAVFAAEPPHPGPSSTSHRHKKHKHHHA